MWPKKRTATPIGPSGASSMACSEIRVSRWTPTELDHRWLLQVLAGRVGVRSRHPYRHHVGEVDDHAILVDLAVGPRPDQDQAAALVEGAGDRLDRLRFPPKSALIRETSSPPTGRNRMISSMLSATVVPPPGQVRELRPVMVGAERRTVAVWASARRRPSRASPTPRSAERTGRSGRARRRGARRSGPRDGSCASSLPA
jgi:hypothetical protein